MPWAAAGPAATGRVPAAATFYLDGTCSISHFTPLLCGVSGNTPHTHIVLCHTATLPCVVLAYLAQRMGMCATVTHTQWLQGPAATAWLEQAAGKYKGAQRDIPGPAHVYGPVHWLARASTQTGGRVDGAALAAAAAHSMLHAYNTACRWPASWCIAPSIIHKNQPNVHTQHSCPAWLWGR